MWVRSTGVPSGARRVLPWGRKRSERVRTGVIRSGLSRAVNGRTRPVLHTLGNLLRDRGRHRRARWGRGADFLPLQFCRGSSDGSGLPIMRLRSPSPCGPRDECGSHEKVPEDACRLSKILSVLTMVGIFFYMTNGIKDMWISASSWGAFLDYVIYADDVLIVYSECDL
ncbi:hypothetical protein NDU88_004466 [Pleurodeles waltl]|uniref:Uncharacterized protein n=1 Tax=Pleurodeles waltl TaxID=8319 RepID=A0AAV7T9U1_PLEWA|nr:hypothetical protein NDU88_004466 [Pleurodeles waltl]